MTINIIERPSNNSSDQEIQPKYIILHCIGYSQERALEILTQTVDAGGGGVSSHYFIPQIEELASSSAPSTYPVYHLVDDTKYAKHAGQSRWLSDSSLNNLSIGIEFSSPNYANASNEKGGLDWLHFEKFPDSQIHAGIELLLLLIEHHNIQPQNILGHSDIAPWRENAAGGLIMGKTDPGGTFPWRELAMNGIGVWPKTQRRRSTPIDLSTESIQSLLIEFGYVLDKSGVMDPKTERVINAFQLHFLPEEFGNAPSEKMIVFLENLIDKDYEYEPLKRVTEHRMGC